MVKKDSEINFRGLNGRLEPIQINKKVMRNNIRTHHGKVVKFFAFGNNKKDEAPTSGLAFILKTIVNILEDLFILIRR